MARTGLAGAETGPRPTWSREAVCSGQQGRSTTVHGANDGPKHRPLAVVLPRRGLGQRPILDATDSGPAPSMDRGQGCSYGWDPCWPQPRGSCALPVDVKGTMCSGSWCPAHPGRGRAMLLLATASCMSLVASGEPESHDSGQDSHVSHAA